MKIANIMTIFLSYENFDRILQSSSKSILLQSPANLKFLVPLFPPRPFQSPCEVDSMRAHVFYVHPAVHTKTQGCARDVHNFEV